MRFFYEKKGNSVVVSRRGKLECGPHLHHHIELVYMIDGCTTATADTSEVTLTNGDIFISFPNQIHSYYDEYVGKSIIAIFPPDLYPEYRSIFSSSIPISPIIKNSPQNEKILNLLEQIIDQNNNKPSQFRDAIVKGYFLILLGEIFQMLKFESIKTVDINTLKSILIYCMQNYTKDIKLSDLENDLHISRYYISHMFSSKLKMGFNEYINSLRVSDACTNLSHLDKSISEIAYGAGFNSLRSFNRAFQISTGLTPSQYRKNKCNMNL